MPGSENFKKRRLTAQELFLEFHTIRRVFTLAEIAEKFAAAQKVAMRLEDSPSLTADQQRRLDYSAVIQSRAFVDQLDAGELDSGRWLDLGDDRRVRSEEHTSELQSLRHLVCRLLLE